jgi:chromosome segregation ATPase
MGVIELIEMHDFMCHRHLKVPFGPKINFIIGHNGSKLHGPEKKRIWYYIAP